MKFVSLFLISESENEGAATQEKQIARELKLLTTKLKTFREKQAASLKERRILREQLKKKQKELKDEKNKYKLLQKEVDKMAKLMKEADEDDYEEEETEEEEVRRRGRVGQGPLKFFWGPLICRATFAQIAIAINFKKSL